MFYDLGEVHKRLLDDASRAQSHQFLGRIPPGMCGHENCPELRVDLAKSGEGLSSLQRRRLYVEKHQVDGVMVPALSFDGLRTAAGKADAVRRVCRAPAVQFTTALWGIHWMQSA